MAVLQSLWQDLRYGARLLRTSPGFAVVAIVSLALGIGANTAIFQLLDAVRMRSLPVRDPQQLAFVRVAPHYSRSGNFTGFYSWLTYAQWEQIRDHQQAFSSIFAFGGDRLNLARGGPARNADVWFVTGEAFTTLGIPPMFGRVFTEADDQRGCTSPGAVISYGFWQREFGGQRSAIGSKLTIEGHPFEVIGVTPADFFGIDVGRYYDVAIPTCAEPVVMGEYSRLDDKNSWWVGVMGRLKPGWTVKQASAQLESIQKPVFEATIPPKANSERLEEYVKTKLQAISADNGVSSLRREYESPLWLLLGIAGMVLLIACANLANLILARASAREREIAVRLALGASRGRLVRQLLAESLLLAALGTVAGAVLAQFVTGALVALLSTQGRPIFVDLAPDWRLLAFAAGLAVLTCMLFGLLPALRVTAMAPSRVMTAGGRSMTASRERFGLRRGLVVSQIALSLVLVAGALLFVRTLRNLMNVDPGFAKDGILIVNVDFSKFSVPKEQREAYKRNLLERVRSIAGVAAAAETEIVPVSGSAWNQSVFVGQEKKGISLLDRVSPGYFNTMQTSIVAGRDFGEQDTATSPPVAIVNESFAKKHFGGNALGKTFHMDVGKGESDPEYEVVGIVRDAKYLDLRDDFEPIGYFPEAQDPRPDQFTEIMIRSTLPASSLSGAVKAVMEDVNPLISIDIRVFKTRIADSLLRERLMATLSGFFGFLAGGLAVIGLYGVIAYMVARRTGEIGIRMALGATPRNVLAMVMREAALLLAIGITAGAALTTAAARTAKALLFGLKPYDPATIAMAVVALALVAAAASYVPARRAAKLEPMSALREE